MILIAHSHIGDGPCQICVEHDKREMAQMFRSVTLRMKLARANKSEFVFEREAADVWDRIRLPEQWMWLLTYERGEMFPHYEEERETA